MSLYTVRYIWKTYVQNKNTVQIVKQAGNMYDEFIRFNNSLNDV